jgi:predicted phosphodiesterase
MRIAVVSDVHGNLTALEAVVADLRRQAPDLILHGGDLPASGARPAAVVDRVRELGWPGVCGNTDEMLWAPEHLAALARQQPRLHEMWRVIVETAARARDALGEERLAWLQGLPRELRHGPLALVHARPGDLWTAPPPAAGDEELAAAYAPLGAAVAVYGHIHQPFVRQVGAYVVANSGSVSLSYDGDPRASYLLIDQTGGSDVTGGAAVSIRRVEYDVEAEAAWLLRSDLPRTEWLGAMLRAGRALPLPPES